MGKRGRGPKVNGMHIRYTVRVSDEDSKQINEYCERTGKNKSDLFREAVLKRMQED